MMRALYLWEGSGVFIYFCLIAVSTPGGVNKHFVFCIFFYFCCGLWCYSGDDETRAHYNKKTKKNFGSIRFRDYGKKLNFA